MDYLSNNKISMEESNINESCAGKHSIKQRGTIDISTIKQLQNIKNKPKCMYYMGNLELLNKPIIAIVGSRKCSKYSQNMCKMFVKDLVEEGFVIASGLAVGIDGVAHISCLENGGKTIAVLAGGIDEIYPEEHKELAEEIIKTGGLLISEKNFQEKTNNLNFPQRNRIISAISIGVLVIEAKYRSGSNITARYAIEQNKALFTIPHNIGTSAIGGMKKLLKIGAKLVYSADEIIEELKNKNGQIKDKVQVDRNQIQKYKTKKKVKLEENLLEVYNAIGNRPIDINYIARMTKKQIQTINYSLVDLEIRGYVKKLPGNKYVINDE